MEGQSGLLWGSKVPRPFDREKIRFFFACFLFLPKRKQDLDIWQSVLYTKKVRYQPGRLDGEEV